MKAAAAGVDLVRRPEPGITILIYHRVGAGNGGQMDLDPATFDEQLRWLTERFEVASLDAAADSIESKVAPQRPTVVLTFDDGTTDWTDEVLPALERHGVPATFYVATGFVEDRLELPGEGTPISWDSLGELAASELVTIGSHTHRHMLLDRLGPDAVAEELDRSNELLSKRMGVEARHFAYPKAVAGSPAADRAVRERFRTAVVAGTRANPSGTDLHLLHRSPIQACDTRPWFRAKANGGLRAEDDLRQLANRIRYRNLDR